MAADPQHQALQIQIQKRLPYRLAGPFPGHVKPARKGVYWRHCNGSATWSYWNGKHWCANDHRRDEAVNDLNRCTRSKYQDATWFGLACTEITPDFLTGEECRALLQFLLDYSKLRLIRASTGHFHLEDRR